MEAPHGRRAAARGRTPPVSTEGESLDEKLRDMLRDLSRALFEAISDSSEVNRSLHRIRQEGYTLHLLLDCKRDGQDRVRLDAPSSSVSSSPPQFRINGQDLSFLRSIGIDPTRRSRRRRTSLPSDK